jgi:hypothetical protein
MPFIEAPAYKANLKRNVLGNVNSVQSSVIQTTSSIEEYDIDNVDIELEAGEGLTADNAGTIISGKIYKSTNLYADAKPPMGIIMEDAAIGTISKLRISGIIPLINITGLTIGKRCYLREGEPNISQIPPAVKSATEDLVQAIGTAIGASEIFIRIETAHRLEC